MRYVDQVTDEMLAKPTAQLTTAESAILERALEQTPGEMIERIDAVVARRTKEQP